MDDTQSNSRKLEKYRRMQRIRQFEDLAESIHAQGEIPGALHTYAGMEASGVGSCMALRDDDIRCDLLGTLIFLNEDSDDTANVPTPGPRLAFGRSSHPIAFCRNTTFRNRR